jgi:hypothetical protein
VYHKVKGKMEKINDDIIPTFLLKSKFPILYKWTPLREERSSWITISKIFQFSPKAIFSIPTSEGNNGDTTNRLSSKSKFNCAALFKPNSTNQIESAWSL